MATNGENLALCRRFVELVFNRGELEATADLVGDDFTNFGQRGPDGAARWRSIATMWRTAFPDVHFTIDEEIVQGNTVVQRVTMRGTHTGELRQPTIGTIPPTGRSFEVDQIHIWDVLDGRIVGHWGTRNDVKLLRQLGIWPPPEYAN